jgi:hypothetical protein
VGEAGIVAGILPPERALAVLPSVLLDDEQCRGDDFHDGVPGALELRDGLTAGVPAERDFEDGLALVIVHPEAGAGAGPVTRVVGIQFDVRKGRFRVTGPSRVLDGRFVGHFWFLVLGR